MCLLKKNPQDLPNSLFLLQLLTLSNLFVNFVINMAVMPFATALLLALLALVLVYGLTTWLLGVLNLKARLRQTLIAILGTDIVIAGPAIVLRYWFEALETSGTQSDSAVLLWLIVFVWNLIVTAHILRHAIGKSFGIGLVVSITYTIVIYNFLFQSHT